MSEKKLYRSKSDRMLGGVCAGIAEYADMSSWLVRLLWILITMILMLVHCLGIFGIIVYILMWWLVPEEGDNDPNVIDAEYSYKE